MTETQTDSTDGRVLRARALREERRAQILLAARRVFAQRGYHAASIQDIIDAAGIARGTFYLYFESKRSLFEVILDELLLQLRGSIRGVQLGSEESPEEQLYGTLRRVLEILLENRDMTAILLRQAVGLDQDFDSKLAEFYTRVKDIVQVAITIGMQMGLLRTVNPALVSTCVIGSIKEVLGDTLAQGQEVDPEALDALTREILDYNLLGVLHR